MAYYIQTSVGTQLYYGVAAIKFFTTLINVLIIYIANGND